jgi:hypothetical protein
VDEIGNILPALFKKEIGRAEPHFLDILLPLWPRIAGKAMAQHSQPAVFASGVLTLNVDSATWGTQLRHMTQEIRTEINRFLGQSIVKKLRIKTAPQPGLFASTRASGQPETLAPPFVQPVADLESVADPEIATALAISYGKYFNRPRS